LHWLSSRFSLTWRSGEGGLYRLDKLVHFPQKPIVMVINWGGRGRDRTVDKSCGWAIVADP
jgi:hypothetical protein